MKTFCTLSDKKYILQGLALYHSLMKANPDFILYYLCLDVATFDIITKLNYDNLKPITLGKLEYQNKELREYKANNDYQHYCWCLGSYFTWYLMNKYNPDNIMYIDSDIYFYQDYNIIYEEIADKSIGIITHRFSHTNYRKTGKYNVGIIYFRNNEIGNKCLEWWKSVVINPDNEYAEDHACCGDQHYLMVFEELFGIDNICIIGEDEKSNVGHAASWCSKNMHYDNGYVIWQGKKQLLIFNHFSHFQPDFDNGTYKTHYENEWRPENTWAKKYYDKYFEEIKKVKNLIS